MFSTVTIQVVDVSTEFLDAVTVIIAVPALIAVTFPVLSTCATSVLLDDQITVLSTIVVGASVAFKTSLSPFCIVMLSLFKATCVHIIFSFKIVKFIFLVILFEVFKVKLSIPADIPVTYAFLFSTLNVAISVLSIDHVKLSSCAVLGVMYGVYILSSPIFMVSIP